MPGLYEITFLPSGRTQRGFGIRGLYYVLPDGRELDMPTALVWCNGCGDISHGEKFETVEERRGIVEYCAGSGLVDDFIKEPVSKAAYRDKLFRELEENEEAWALWRALRTSAPRCVRCGSTDIVHFPRDGESVPHPPSGERMSLRAIGMCSTDFMNWYYTPDGVRISRDTKPTNWHHPAEDEPGFSERFRAWMNNLVRRKSD